MMRLNLIVTALSLLLMTSDAFVAPASLSPSSLGGSTMELAAFDAIKEPVQQYVNIWYA